eukprot:COSAG02_NODE_17781_length_981_cov_1.638322_1_plen_83_part_01
MEVANNARNLTHDDRIHACEMNLRLRHLMPMGVAVGLSYALWPKQAAGIVAEPSKVSAAATAAAATAVATTTAAAAVTEFSMW